ncbi:hypothetical protein EMIHUDRAFT_234836 [Emiliania huxleyi CCMP1516]|uniref:Uncharacterized protein n=2 Tax=Emiliania huxleyi TaxID=2903 RepID=A0A0D3JYU1_EMIH1|nr:hypothetical protein EMIHUDRAFT_234836 [Emiliania huxleyi CCMP1516]EOD28676.1 hypothetical protein EMIHUDRAFT_234836 [Emiliania huxleyi CCMP1516]|eukprot:XP_005781105.1 hypothetical protein EMIHUDRAFT_234836 [Emiliania huxleyi CCMP1516]
MPPRGRPTLVVPVCSLAEPLVHLDPEVGACCHSACSDCEWRLPDGGYRFDVLKATKPKWVPCYLRRDFGDERGCHEPRWASALFPGGGEVTRAQFGEALAGLGFEMPMGPRGSVGADGGVPESAADALWAWLAGDGDALTPEGARTRLQAMAEDPQAEGAVGEGPDHLVWKEFAKDAARGGRCLLLLCGSYGGTAIEYGLSSGQHGLDYCIAEADTTIDTTASTTMAAPTCALPWTNRALYMPATTWAPGMPMLLSAIEEA